jgi:large subunit ribosomal protein L10
MAHNQPHSESAARTVFPKDKVDQLTFLKDAFKNIEAAVLTSVQGLTVAEVSDLRRRLHDAGVQYRVVKNTLAKKAVKGTPLEAVTDDFRQVTAVAWSDTDPVGPAKVISGFKKDVQKFIIKAGFQGGVRLDAAGVDALSKMPSLDELRAQLLGVIQAVPAKLLAQVNAPAQHIVGVLQAKHDEDEKKAA